METKYPTMRRPKRKLCYITDKESLSNQWNKPLTVTDFDKLFDDIDSCFADPQPPSVLSSDTGTNSPQKENRSPATRSARPKLDIDLDLPAETHRPMKTSSPIELEMGEEKDNAEEQIASPILFNCEDDIAEEFDPAPLPTETPKKKETGTKKGQENTELLDRAVSRKSVVGVSVNKRRPGEIPSPAAKQKTPFLEKLQVNIQSSKQNLKKAQVTAPPPPDPEDDFLILEDDATFWISIPSKSVSKRKQRQSLTSSPTKESSPDKGTVEIPSEIPQERLESEKGNGQLESQAVDQKNKKKKGKEKTQKSTGNGKTKEDLSDYRELPADDLVVQEEKKKNVESKKRRNAEVQSKDKSNEESDNEKPSEKMQTKERKSSDKRTTKDNKKTTKKSLEKTVKDASKQTQKRAVLEKDATDVGPSTNQMQEEGSKEPTDTEEQNVFTDEEFVESKENRKNKKLHLPVESERSSSEETQKTERRKRKPPGQWWLSSQSGEENPNEQPKPKKLNKVSKKPNAAACSPVEAKKHSVEQFSKQKSERKEKKPKRTRKRQNAEEVESAKSKATDELSDMEEQEIPDQNLDQVQSSHLMLTPRHKSDKLFQKVYNNVCSAKMSTPSAATNDPLCERETGNRRRKPPGDWWSVSVAADEDDLERISWKHQQLHPKKTKPSKANKQSKQSKPAKLPQNGNTATPVKAAGGALKPLLKPLSPPKSVRRSLKDVFPADAEPLHNVPSHSAKECSYSDCTTGNTFDKDSEEVGRSTTTRFSHNTHPNPKRQSDTLKALQSGPSSMIVLEQYEDNDNTSLPSSHLRPVLCVSDLCAPPLRPLTLHPKDKANLDEWLQALWSTTSDNGAAVTAEHFEWYSYQDRALGFQVDLNSGSICSGKILLGSHMKKPLWVDHSATTVFNVLTSTVRVNIDSTVFRFRPGQSFIVECGRAYSLQNLNAEPAVLYFTRIVAESSD
ncbi:hypothetical protein OJAV_G00197540 [Oryzias javanicus]|uniref:Mif2/CENP-C cupin domain-containing protein n=1 Tax=Oryzias javanicus TaxID=123683 RepID=A0A3S2M2K0_ORYJA|nr:hypothetical protein OJAV_G00197540 [Oryzias javanicus]